MCPRPWSVLSLLVLILLGSVVAPPRSHAVALVEDCGNCVDDDDDQLIDRADPDCAPLANGGGAGIGDPIRGKAILKCHKAIQKAGVAFSAKRLKGLHACVDPAFACVQLKPNDPACLTKAAAKCLSGVPASDAAQAKLLAAIAKACDPAQVSHDDLGADLGLGLDKEAAACTQEGVSGPNTIATFANCVLRQHVCRTNAMLSQGLPRSRELFLLMGFPVDPSALPCLLPGSDGGGQGLGAFGKPAVKCGKAITKASLKVGGAVAKALQKCLDFGSACLQLKNGDPACIANAQSKCQKISDKVQDRQNGTFVKLLTAAVKSCSGLSTSQLQQNEGLGFGVQSDRCNTLDAAQVGSQGTIGCAGVQQLCEGKQMLLREIPRLEELFALLNLKIIGLP